MWQTTFCPTFSPIFFTFIIWAVNTIVYLSTLSATIFLGDYMLNNKVFMGPDSSLLIKLGCLDRDKIYFNYQWYRLLTSLFLAPGFQFYVINSVVLMIIGFMVENRKMT